MFLSGPYRRYKWAYKMSSLAIPPRRSIYEYRHRGPHLASPTDRASWRPRPSPPSGRGPPPADRLPAALIQGQRDFFGAHTYQRVDKKGTFHTLWSGDRSELEAEPAAH